MPTDLQLVTDILYRRWPAHCELMGPAALHDIVRNADEGGGEDQFKASDGGADLVSPEAVEVLVHAANLVLICVRIWAEIKKQKPTTTTKEDLIERTEREVNNATPEVKKHIAEIAMLLTENTLENRDATKPTS